MPADARSVIPADVHPRHSRESGNPSGKRLEGDSSRSVDAMSIEALLSNFDRLIQTPESVQRLRRFILDLAVRGKLVPQDPDDEPATELLKRIAKEKERANGFLKDLLPPVSENEQTFPTPKSWEWARLGNVSASMLGKTLNQAKNRGTYKPYLRSVNVYWLELKLSDVKQMKFEEEELEKYALRKDDVLVCEGGEAGRAAVWNEEVEGIYYQNALHRVRFFGKMNPNYFVFALCSDFNNGRLESYCTGVTIKHLTSKRLARYCFPVPPLAEQGRIVAKVDELMGLCDRLEAARTKRETTRTRLTAASFAHLNAPDPDEARFQEHAKFALDNFASLTARPEQVKVLRHTILNLAVQGKLVPQDPADKPAAELLKLIQIEKASLIKLRGIKTDKHSCPAVRDGLNFSLKPGWISVRLRQILLELQTGPFGTSLHQSDYEKAGTPVVNPASIQNGRIVPIEKMAVGSTTLERLAAFRLRQRDIVMSRRGEMGRCAKVTEREDGWLCGTGSLILRLPKCIHSCFLVILLGSPYVREYLNSSAVGATMQNLNQSILLNLVIGLPPLAEQQRIVAKVDKLMRLCDRLERSVETEDHKRTLLVEALLCRSVSNLGIVPSDRSDSNALRNAVQGHELEAT